MVIPTGKLVVGISPTGKKQKKKTKQNFSLNVILHSSPWSNEYYPALEDGALPTDRLRKLEVEANAAFDQYRQMYFEGGVSSVYLWDLDHGFAGNWILFHF